MSEYKFEPRGVGHDALTIGGASRELSVAVTADTNGGVKIAGYVTPELAAYIAELQRDRNGS